VSTDSLVGSNTALATILWCTCFTEQLWFHLLVIKESTDWKVAKSCSPLSTCHERTKYISDFSTLL